MADIHEFRTATLTYGSDNLTFVVEALVEERWETLDVPLYLDQPTIRLLPTLNKIVARIRRRYHPGSPLHAGIEGSPATLVFTSNGEVHQFTQARVIEWKVFGKLGGEMMEEVELACEGESE